MNFRRSEFVDDAGESEDNYRSTSGSDEEEKLNSPTPFLKDKLIDIHAYASNYRRRMKILRLVFIADRFGDSNERRRMTQLGALQIAYDEAKKGKDVALFTKIAEKIRGRLGPNYAMDENWRNSVNQEKQVISQMLQRCTKNSEICYANRIISADDARILFNAVADFHHIHGAPATAFEFYKKSVRFCRTDEDLSEFLSRVLLTVIDLGQFEHVAKMAEKGIQNPKLNPMTTDSLRCALGLARFKAQRYKDAAHQFLGISKELGNRFSDVMAAHDIAAFGALCALATFEPLELKTLVMDNENFQFYLDSAVEVKELIKDFCTRRYSSFLKHFDNIKGWLLLDIHFYNHFDTLYDQIRCKALVQYTEPFVSIGLQRVAVVFGSSIEAIEKDLVTLINTNQIQADIDPVDKVLRVRKV